MRVHLQHHVADCDPPTAGWLEEQLARAAALAGEDDGETAGGLGVTLVADAQMAELHGRCMGEPTTTDVLSFDYRDPDPAPETAGPASLAPLDGDLVICMDEAARQAAARGRDTRLEVLLYAVHGLLHLLGEDDLTHDAYARMHRREDDLLTRLGVGPLFAPASVPSHIRPALGPGVERPPHREASP